MFAIALAALLCAPAAPARPPGGAAAAPDSARLKLKPGAGGKLCLQCHADLAGKLQRKFVHTPARNGECIACHDPHASAHGKLLSADPKAICTTCHEDVIPARAKSVHKPVHEGACAGCHDPHAGDNRFQLLQTGNKVCSSCHGEIVNASMTAKFRHKPVERGCNTCHDAHASTAADSLLKGPQPQLCLECHKANATFSKAHAGFAVAKTTCTRCHDPHGSSRKGMLNQSAHQPMATKMCTQCHLDPAPGKAIALRREGVALCKECHSVRVAQMMEKARVHWAIQDATACLRCHDPHSSRQPKLVSGRRMDALCGTCHADTIGRQARSPTKHAPVRDGKCTSCHDPHSSDNLLMLKDADVIEGCGRCHDWQKHATHPIGEKMKDPRNRNLTLDCLSCHRAHGTEYKSMLPYPTTTDLCTKCHREYKR